MANPAHKGGGCANPARKGGGCDEPEGTPAALVGGVRFTSASGYSAADTILLCTH